MARLDDGYQTLITFSLKPSIKLYEKSVTPPGRDGGGPNPVATMRNTKWRVQAPKHLQTVTGMQAKVAYDTAALADIDSMVNQNQQITISYPDGSSEQFWGYVDKWNPDEIVEGAQPTGTIVIEPTMQDDSGVETDPVYTPAP